MIINKIKPIYGSSDQTADSDLVSESMLSGQLVIGLRGIAYMYVRLKFDADAFPNGIPVITATVKGKKLYDPRTSTTVWSDNPALCLRDYLTSKYGLAEDDIQHRRHSCNLVQLMYVTKLTLLLVQLDILVMVLLLLHLHLMIC